MNKKKKWKIFKNIENIRQHDLLKFRDVVYHKTGKLWHNYVVLLYICLFLFSLNRISIFFAFFLRLITIFIFFILLLWCFIWDPHFGCHFGWNIVDVFSSAFQNISSIALLKRCGESASHCLSCWIQSIVEFNFLQVLLSDPNLTPLAFHIHPYHVDYFLRKPSSCITSHSRILYILADSYLRFENIWQPQDHTHNIFSLHVLESISSFIVNIWNNNGSASLNPDWYSPMIPSVYDLILSNRMCTRTL